MNVLLMESSAGTSIHFTPSLLSTLLKTLAIILHAAGPSTPALPQMTAELWDLLFALRRTDEENVLEGILFAMLTLLEVNAENGERLAREHPKELIETQEWVAGIVTGGEGKIGALAASVLIRIREVVEGFQRRLMGQFLSLEE
jgi:telomere length regulation protein